MFLAACRGFGEPTDHAFARRSASPWPRQLEVHGADSHGTEERDRPKTCEGKHRPPVGNESGQQRSGALRIVPAERDQKRPQQQPKGKEKHDARALGHREMSPERKAERIAPARPYEKAAFQYTARWERRRQSNAPNPRRAEWRAPTAFLRCALAERAVSSYRLMASPTLARNSTPARATAPPPRRSCRSARCTPGPGRGRSCRGRSSATRGG
jgi:hypothetical protein